MHRHVPGHVSGLRVGTDQDAHLSGQILVGLVEVVDNDRRHDASDTTKHDLFAQHTRVLVDGVLH